LRKNTIIAPKRPKMAPEAPTDGPRFVRAAEARQEIESNHLELAVSVLRSHPQDEQADGVTEEMFNAAVKEHRTEEPPDFAVPHQFSG
jgi:hypothetical protein